MGLGPGLWLGFGLGFGSRLGLGLRLGLGSVDLPLRYLGALRVERVLLGERDAMRRAQRVHELSDELRRTCLGLGVGLGVGVGVGSGVG